MHLPFISANSQMPQDAPRAIRPSAKLRTLIRCYFEMVDSESTDADKTTIARFGELVLDTMRSEHVPFHTAQEGLWIARWLYAGTPVNSGKKTKIMFARTPDHSHPGEYDPIRDEIHELTSLPFASLEEERTHSARRIPVLVTVEPLHH